MRNNRAAQLNKIAEEIPGLEESPLYDYRKENNYSPVIGEGDLQAAIMFVGEAPGEQEAKSGRPFVGSAGRVLDELLGSIGLDREDVYITNVVKDRPLDNRDPSADEVQLYAPFLTRQIEIIRPKVLVALGRFAMDFILQEFNMDEQGQKISSLHGKMLKARASYGDVVIVPLYHPAVTFYSADRRDVLEQDFQVLRQFV
jgi:uracil-DNA glycosylase family 4